ncbi:hypothetical protein [Streptomyces sp. NPDC017230]|uniref:hypothetical protein n=1 Tax=unclassified Streptomyces TaxID=2593676 RepID=UPI0037B5BD16
MTKPSEVDQVDQDDIVRARNILLASGRRSPREEVDAYRVLVQVSPAVYLPRLARALRQLGHDRCYDDRPEARLALFEEAVAVARAVDPAQSSRADLLYEALDWCQWQLYEVGRRAEGLVLRGEMLSIGRARAESPGGGAVRGLDHPWATGLSEEGRYAEAADALTESVARQRSAGRGEDGFAWTVLQWIAALDAAGRPAEALTAMRELVDMKATQAANDRGPMACHLYVLIRYAQMLDSAARPGEATAVRGEALALLTALAVHGERKSWSGYQTAFWAVLFSVSGADSERPAPGAPRPPAGTDPLHWSPDTRRQYFRSLKTLRDEVDGLALRAGANPDHLSELVRLQRVFTVRSTVHWRFRSHRAGQVRSLFDEGVDLARRLLRYDADAGTRALATALTDRATFHVAAEDFDTALADFRQVPELLARQADGVDGPATHRSGIEA